MALVVKNPPANPGDTRYAGLIPGSGKSPAGGNGNPFQFSCLENSVDRGVWRVSLWVCKESDTTEETEHTHLVIVEHS